MNVLDIIDKAIASGVALSIKEGRLSANIVAGEMSAELREEIKANKDDILAYLQNIEEQKKVELVKVSDAEKESCEVSYAQKRLWFVNKVDARDSYNNIISADLHGKLDIDSLEKALIQVIARHEPLRTCYKEREGKIYAEVINDAAINISHHHCHSSVNEDEFIQSIVANESQRHFDLSKELPICVSLIQLSEAHTVLVINIHHIASDDWSLGILLSEVGQLYSAYVNGNNVTLAPLDVEYRDYVFWQSKNLSEEKLVRQVDFWANKLELAPEVHALPLDNVRPSRQSYKSATFQHAIDKEILDQIRSLCQKLDTTLYVYMQSVFSLLISRYSNTNDVIMGSAESGRAHQALTPLVGMFANTIVLRNQIPDNSPFIDYLQQNKRSLSEAFEYQQTPFEHIVEKLNPGRSLSYSPIFQIVFTLQSAQKTDFSLSGLTVNARNDVEELAKFDLHLSVTNKGDELLLKWIYNVELFASHTIENFALSFSVLLGESMQKVNKPIHELNIIPARDFQKIAYQWNETKTEGVEKELRFIQELFQQQALSQPDNIAVIEGERTLSYGALDKQSKQYARYLMDQGVCPGAFVGLSMGRTIEMVIGILAILKTGAVYVPIDPNAPKERIKHIVKDSGIKTLISDQAMDADALADGVNTLALNNITEYSQYPDDDIDLGGYGEKQPLSYVIYTSGSTGLPKGVMLSHQGLLNLALYKRRRFKLSSEDCVLQFASIGFDAAVSEWMMALAAGARLCMISDEQKSSMDAFRRCIKQHAVTCVTLPPAFLHAHDVACLQNLKVLIVAGEDFPAELANSLLKTLPKVNIFNAYGPSEGTVCSTCYHVTAPVLRTVPIGRPIENVSCYILNAQGTLQPIGAFGELCISGDNLAVGYIHPEPSMEKFVSIFIENKKVNVYRTGDIARWLPSGELEFGGRIDTQVKLRGFRIEPGEIENCLLKIPGLKQAVVILWRDTLVAYVSVEGIAAQDEAKSAAYIQEIKQTVKHSLPDYMMPSQFICLDELPVTINGKLDKNALPEPQAFHKAYAEARNDGEKKLVEIWQDILGIDEAIGIDDNFFALGGHSLLATRLISEIRSTFGIELPIRIIFENSDIRSLASALENNRTGFVIPDMQAAKNSGSGQLSFAQQRLWFIDRLGHGSSQYNTPTILALDGLLDFASLEKALNEIIERHHVLRTNFIEEEGEVKQLVKENYKFTLEVISLLDMPEADRDARVRSVAEEDANHIFDLEKDLLLTAKVMVVKDNEFVILLNTHHIASDGWSMSIFIDELCQLYSGFVSGKRTNLPAVDFQYIDYANWQRAWMSDEAVADELVYWKNKLLGAPQLHSMPVDKIRPAVQTFECDFHIELIDSSTTFKINQYCQSKNVTLFMFLHTAFSIFLSRYSGVNDVVVGVPLAGRTHKDTEKIIGFFVNNIALRTLVDGEQDFASLLADNSKSMLKAYDHQHIPFDVVVDEIQPDRSLSYNPIFQVVFAVQNFQQAKIKLPDLTIKPIEDNHNSVQYDLGLHVMEWNNELYLRWSSNKDIFYRSTIERFARNFNSLVSEIINNEKNRIKAYSVVCEQEYDLLINRWNQTAFQYPKDKAIHNLFEQQADKTPEACAALFDGETVTYQALNEQANQLAHFLIKQGVRAESVVALSIDKSIDMLVGMLAILKAGAAYLPIDPDYPSERVEYMVEDAGVNILLTHRDYLSDFIFDDLIVIPIDEDSRELFCSGFDSGNVDTFDSLEFAHSPAYVIYTSGSTGKAKGVVATHQNVVGLVFDTDYVAVEPFHSIAHASSISFDAATFEIWTALLHGARVVSINKDILLSPPILAQTLRETNTDILFVTTALFNQIAYEEPACFSTLKYVLFGGEKVNYDAVHRIIDNGKPEHLLHVYGPTETTTFSTFIELDGKYSSERLISIGRPLKNVTTYVLDKDRSPVPVGAVGELYIGGRGVARGYLNRPELTAEKFVQNPFSNQSEDLVYRTGDLVRWLASGEIEFVGRIDSQVKVRGFRIELDEIQLALTSLNSIREAAVVAVENAESTTGDKQIAAYIVVDREEPEEREEGCDLDMHTQEDLREKLIREIRNELSEILPGYMIPSFIILIDFLPLNNNGKVDKKRLPEPSSVDVQYSYVAPRNHHEQIMSDIWSEILGVNKVGVFDNIFAIGGDSILSIKIVSKAKKNGMLLSVKDIFQHQTIAELVANIEISDIESDVDEENTPFSLLNEEQLEYVQALECELDDAYPLSELQRGMLFHSMLDSDGSTYHDICSFHIEARWSSDAFKRALDLMAAQHPVLRTTYEMDLARPLQLIHRSNPLAINFSDIREQTSAQQESTLDMWMDNEKSIGFVAEKGLIRVYIHLRSETSFQVSLSFHHAVLDGWSHSIFMSEMLSVYTRLLDGQDVNDVNPEYTFKEFIAIEQKSVNDEQHKAYWAKNLEGVSANQIPKLAVPKVGEHKAVELRVDDMLPVSGDILRISRELGVPVQAILLTVHNKVLSLLSGNNRVLTSVVNNGRPEREGAENGVGLFLNSLPIQFELIDTSWRKQILSVADKMAEAILYRHFPSSAIQRDNNIDLSEVLFNYTHFRAYSKLSNNQDLKILDTKYFEKTNYGFSVTFSRALNKDVIGMRISYSENQYAAQMIEKVGQYYVNAFKQIVAGIDKKHSAQRLISDSEEARLLELASGPVLAVDEDLTLVDVFEASSQTFSDNIALIQGDNTLSYAQLNAQANQLARYLKDKGFGCGDFVGIQLEPSFDMLVSVFAILKTGAAYVAIDPNYPQARIAHIIQDAALACVITHEALTNDTPAAETIVLDCKEVKAALSVLNPENPVIKFDQAPGEHLAYLVYTSGSTGLPKASMISHQSVINLTQWYAEAFDFSAQDKTLLLSSFSFDLTQKNLFSPLMKGGSLVLPSHSEFDVEETLALIEKTKVSKLNCAPSHFYPLVDGEERYSQVASLNCVLLGGEHINRGRLVPWLSNPLNQCRVINMYGPSECTDIALFEDVTDALTAGTTIALGKPNPNVQVYILGSDGHLCPTYVTGEIVIGGMGVSKGYLNNTELTREKFIDSPFAEGEKLYRTGDLGRRLANGSIAFAGRVDHQVKIRGMRVELGEIEKQLQSLDEVKEAVVITNRKFIPEHEEHALWTYLVVAEGSNVSDWPAYIRNALRRVLPDHMVPTQFMLLDEMPLTPNGKIDRNALPAIEGVLAQTREYVAPRTELEQLVCSTMSEVLGVTQVGLHDDFFVLGGHSLLATHFASLIRKQLNFDVSIRVIFETPRVLDLASQLSKLQNISKLEKINQAMTESEGDVEEFML